MSPVGADAKGDVMSAPPRHRLRSTLAAAGLYLLAAATLPGAAAAAPTTYADVLGVCNGHSPCFLAIGEAVANAGPGAATVYVFPGTYAESVDLATMGSALPGGGPAALSMISVDAAGVPTPGAVIDPAAPGGPGVGNAIVAVEYPAPIHLEGFVVSSPDETAVSILFGTASIEVVRLTADNSPHGAGVNLFTQSGDVSITASRARLNDGQGLTAATFDGRATVTASIAERNGLEGILAAGAEVEVHGVHVEANGTAGLVLGTTIVGARLSLSDVEAIANAEEGVVAFGVVAPGWFGMAEVERIEAHENLGNGIVVLAGVVAANDIQASGNGGQGVALGAYDLVPGEPLSIEASDVVSTDNAMQGILLFGRTVAGHRLTATGNGEQGVWLAPTAPDATVSADEVVATGNRTGIYVFTPAPAIGTVGSAVLSDSDANDNLEDGVIVGADRARLERVTASGNAETGITALALDTTLVGCRVADNREGILATGDLVRIADCRAAGNGPAGGGTFEGYGFILVEAGRVSVVDSFALGNDLGWLLLDLDAAPATGFDADVLRRSLPEGTARYLDRSAPQSPEAPGHRFTFETTRTEASLGASMQIGLTLDAEVRIGCSNFVGNGPAGLALLTDNLVEATPNYWGDPSGPTHPGNPGGVGDAIHDAAAGFAGTVLFDPFLAAEATAGDCPVTPVQEIPTLGGAGLAALALALAVAAAFVLRRRTARLAIVRGRRR